MTLASETKFVWDHETNRGNPVKEEEQTLQVHDNMWRNLSTAINDLHA
jgi:hypothetical protein